MAPLQTIESVVFIGIEKICPNCGLRFLCCEHCWRGNKYCSPSCSKEGRRQNRRVTEKKYSQSRKGRENRRRRQKNFRSRIILGIKVTDHSPPMPSNKILVPSDRVRLEPKQCCHCGKPCRAIALGSQYASPEENNYFSIIRFRSKAHHFSF